MKTYTNLTVSLSNDFIFLESLELGDLTTDVLILFGLTICCVPDALSSNRLLSQVDAGLRVVFSFLPPESSLNIPAFVSVFLPRTFSQNVNNHVCQYIQSFWFSFRFSRSIESRDFLLDRLEMARAIADTEALVASGRLRLSTRVVRSPSDAIFDMCDFDSALGIAS